jgi:hypothetical protein
MWIIGIDPGLKGALVLLKNGNVQDVAAMPLIGKELDLTELIAILEEWLGTDSEHNYACHIFIEDVHAIFGSSAAGTFTFGFVCGALRALVSSMKVPYTLVQPKKWQKVMYQGIPEMRNAPKKLTKAELVAKSLGEKVRTPKAKGSINTKAMSLVAAKRLFPNVDLRKNTSCTVAHDGIVDALLIAEFGRRLLNV